MMSHTEFSKFLNDLTDDIIDKPIQERLRTRALGNDPLPIIVFDITDIGIFSLDLTKDRASAVKTGRHPDAQLTITSNLLTFQSLWSQKKTAFDALYHLELKLSGNLRLAHALQRYFDPQLALI